MNNQEIWKPVKGYENYYEVSNMGNVRSLDRIIIKKNGVLYKRKGKLLKPQQNATNKFLQVMLFLHCSIKLHYVHRLVANAFCQNPNNFKTVTHLDGNPTNNKAENLNFIEKREYKRVAETDNNRYKYVPYNA